jgi:hypothetical protein
MFLKDDIYTSFGSTKLFNCWTEKVSKFDTSSFYNWEQDNLPLYDLEDRTIQVWEKLGFPTSSIGGVALAVSADAPDSVTGCNKNVFKSVSAAIAALPQTINFPVIIEVGSFGSLGDLVLDNFKFGPRGSLEIINRNFAKSEGDASAQYTSNGNPIINSILLNILYGATTNNTLGYASSVICQFTSFNNNKLFSVRGHFLDSSCISIGTNVFSSITDSRFTSNFNGFVSPYTKFGKSNLISESIQSPFNAASGTIDFKVFDLDTTKNTYDSISTYDVSTIDEFDGSLLSDNLTAADFQTYYALNAKSKGLFYGNKLDKIVVTNCDGPIFIRNFFLDGNGANRTDNYYGIEISDSNNIYLENNVVCRYRKAGLYVNNSNVKLLRGFVATRIYNFDGTNTRLTNPWNTRRKGVLFNSTNVGTSPATITYDDPAAGILANNSNIELSSTRVIEEILQNNTVSSYYTNGGPGGTGNYFTKYLPFINENCVFEISKNTNGIILNNSNLIGGDLNTRLINFNVCQNVGNGIKCSNSKVSLDVSLNVYENLKGITLESSVLEAHKLLLQYNQKFGIDGYGSQIIYNKNLVTGLDQALKFNFNGQHLKLNNSKITPIFTSGMDSIFTQIIFDESMGTKNNNSTTDIPIPAIEINNNSEAILISVKSNRSDLHSNSSYSLKGSQIQCNNNSKVRLIGAKNYATIIKGPPIKSNNSKLAAVYAGDSSQIEINGPTVIYGFGVDLLADNNSKININPHKSNYDGSIDVSSFNLSNGANHTAVELHSTRACIVVDNKSTLSMRDLGSTSASWIRSGNTSLLTTNNTDYKDVVDENFTSSGSIQFYPNPIADSYVATPGTGIYGVAFPATTAGTDKFIANTNPNAGAGRLHFILALTGTATSNDLSTVTGGGYCVRALNGSLVDIHNVTFPCGYGWQPSAAYFDANLASINSKLFIWNIADNSQLKASHISVSGSYPSATKYQGPLGLWTSGAGIPASGLPMTTPDTSSISILDYFGSGVTHPFAKTSAENYGPFRLYFSVDPITYSLFDVNNSQTANSSYGILPQIYSQGYQPSGNVGVFSGVSATYVSIWNKPSTTLLTSGYLYGSGVVDPTRGRIVLDQSAAETFANAKHCSVGKSGNAKLVSIQYPYKDSNYGSSYNNRGLKSVNVFDIERDN